ncbi:MAG: hypothetical protein U0176_08090 [Bacteroidia bacterium]
MDIDGRVKWQTEISTETIAMHLPVVVANGLAVTASKAENMSYSLQAYDIESGDLVWTAPCDWTGSNTYGGIFVREGRIFVPKGGKMMIPPAEILDIRTGKAFGEIKEWQALPTMQGIGALNRNCVQVGNWLFSNMKDEGVFRADLSAVEPKFEAIPDTYYARLIAAGNAVTMLCQHQDEPVILSLDADTLKVLHRHPLESVEQAIGDAIEIRAIDSETALIIADNGLMSLSLISGQANWTYIPPEPVDRWSGGLLIDGSFIVGEVRDIAPTLTEIAIQTGDVLQSISSRELFLGKCVFAMGDRILADATASFLQFERQATAPILGEATDFFSAQSIAPPSMPPLSTFTPTDQQYSAIITAFVNAKAAQEQGRDADHERLATEFNKLFDAFAQEHPEVSIANIARTLSELGVPYEVALGDVVRMRG